MSKFIKVTDVTFLANPDSKERKPEQIVINSDYITHFSTEKDRYFLYGESACTVIRVTGGKWGYIVAESMKDIIEMINSK